jgi:transcriptional regulator
MSRPPALLHGALDALILRTLAWGPRHGYAVARWLEETAGAALKIEEGSLYPALYRLEERGWIEAEWGVSELGRRAKFYRLTAQGREQLVERTREWESFAAAVSRVLLGAPEAGPT